MQSVRFVVHDGSGVVRGVGFRRVFSQQICLKNTVFRARGVRQFASVAGAARLIRAGELS
jgi:hypothetical protein